MRDPKRLLLVEDNEDDILLTLRCFKLNKIANDIDVVRDGAEALEYLFSRGRYAKRSRNERLAAVVLDLKLPKIGGLEVLKAIRSESSTKRLPVIILTTSKEDSDLMGSYDLGANSYIQKPVDLDAFFETIRQMGTYWLDLNEKPPVVDA